MKLHHVLCLAGIAWAGLAFAGKPDDPCTAAMDSAAIVDAIHQAQPWIAEELHALQSTSDPDQVRSIASLISRRTDSLSRRFREVFPDNDDGVALFSIYSGLAAATEACNPGLAAVYRATAASALANGEDAYRPPLYHALNSISERSWSLARAKDPGRVQRLLEKLRSGYMDLVVAL